MRTLSGHKGLVRSVAFSRDGKRVVSGSHDSLVKIWNVETGVEVSSHACTDRSRGELPCVHLVKRGIMLGFQGRESRGVCRRHILNRGCYAFFRCSR